MNIKESRWQEEEEQEQWTIAMEQTNVLQFTIYPPNISKFQISGFRFGWRFLYQIVKYQMIYRGYELISEFYVSIDRLFKTKYRPIYLLQRLIFRIMKMSRDVARIGIRKRLLASSKNCKKCFGKFGDRLLQGTYFDDICFYPRAELPPK